METILIVIISFWLVYVLYKKRNLSIEFESCKWIENERNCNDFKESLISDIQSAIMFDNTEYGLQFLKVEEDLDKLIWYFHVDDNFYTNISTEELKKIIEEL